MKKVLSFLCVCTMLSTLCFQPTQLKNAQAESIDTNGNKTYEETTKVNLKEFNLSLVNGEPKISKKNNALLDSANSISDEKNVSNFNELMKDKAIKKSVTQEINLGRKPVAIAAKSVYVSKDQQLLTKDEVIKYRHQPTGQHKTAPPKGKLTLSINISVSCDGQYWLQSNASWNLLGFHGVNTSDTPGVGDDFIGLHWGSNYCTMSNPSATGAYQNGSTFSPYVATIAPNEGEIWGFQDDIATSAYSVLATRVCAGVGIRTVGNPQYTAFVASYAHTWTNANFTPSFGASQSGISGGISLQPSKDSWSIAVSASGYY